MKETTSHPQLEIFGRNRYHRTTKVSDEKTLQKRERKAQSQDDKILEFFRLHKYETFTPSQIHLVFGQQWPITSVRRALTNLTKNEDLVMTDQTRPGLYGAENHTWKYNPNKQPS